MKCPNCSCQNISNNGHRRGKQNYICRVCCRQFIESYSQKGYPKKTKVLCLKMYVNGSGFRAIERVTGVNHNTVINWVKHAAQNLPPAPPPQEIPEISQVDELETFVVHRELLTENRE